MSIYGNEEMSMGMAQDLLASIAEIQAAGHGHGMDGVVILDWSTWTDQMVWLRGMVEHHSGPHECLVGLWDHPATIGMERCDADKPCAVLRSIACGWTGKRLPVTCHVDDLPEEVSDPREQAHSPEVHWPGRRPPHDPTSPYCLCTPLAICASEHVRK